MRVLLINPKSCSPRSLRLPLSLLSLAAVLQDQFRCNIVDGNIDPDPVASSLGFLADGMPSLVAVSVMPGPQVAPAIAISRAIRHRFPRVPIVWGGYFPTLYMDSAINADYVDFLIRGQGEAALLELAEVISATKAAALPRSCPEIQRIQGLSWKSETGVHHNPERPFTPPNQLPDLPYEMLQDPGRYLRPSFLGSRTAVHQASIGCRYRCSFCGVNSMFNGHTRHQTPEQVVRALARLRNEYGADSVQFYDHNFFDRDATTTPLLEALAHLRMPYWCYARADALANLPARSWELARKSRFRMAYIGAETASDVTLKGMHKGTRVDQTFEAAARCREFGVIPEFSFILGGPDDPEESVEETLRFIRKLKTIHPQCEVVLYFYSPTPQRQPNSDKSGSRNGNGSLPVLKSYGAGGPQLPSTPEEWTEQRWIDYVCHQDAPWLSERTRKRVTDFSHVLACRFPTFQDYKTPAWGKALLRTMAAWRYASQCYSNPRELVVARRLVRLRVPQSESL